MEQLVNQQDDVGKNVRLGCPSCLSIPSLRRVLASLLGARVRAGPRAGEDPQGSGGGSRKPAYPDAGSGGGADGGGELQAEAGGHLAGAQGSVREGDQQQ